MKYDKAYKLIRQYTLSLLRYPPLTQQIPNYGEMTAEEIVQDISLSVWMHWDETWDDGLIRFVVSRRLIDLYRTRKQYSCLKGELGDWNEPRAEMEGLDTLLDLRKNWAAMSDADRDIIEKALEGQNHDEIGGRLGITAVASRMRLRRARVTLQNGPRLVPLEGVN